MIYANGYGHHSQRNFFLVFTLITETPQAFLPRSRRVAAKEFFFTQVKMEKTDQKESDCRSPNYKNCFQKCNIYQKIFKIFRLPARHCFDIDIYDNDDTQVYIAN